jgi:FtsP/CotA-like multicopper oxidase with cupredoxin domain
MSAQPLLTIERMDFMTTAILTPFLDALTVPENLEPKANVTVRIKDIPNARLHSELPRTPLWTYAGSLPGPTIEVRKGQVLEAHWKNNIHSGSKLPVVVVETPYDDATADPIPQNGPGSNGQPVVVGTDNLPSYTVVHLHGGRTQADSDGWPDSVHVTGTIQTDVYDNDQRARMLWYHDHAMAVTRLNVYAGLAGMYVIRDDEEDALGLPSGDKEIPLMLMDRNLELDIAGNFTGQMLHKTETNTGPMEFFGPNTLVNGTIWSHCDVTPQTYRLRWLNASNARTYRLAFCVENTSNGWDMVASDSGFVQQIGTDAGLLQQAVNLPFGGLVLSPAERADLLVNFDRYAGKLVRIYNTAEAPFNGQDPWPGAPDEASEAARRPYPAVMVFRVATGPAVPAYVPPVPLSSFVWKPHDQIVHSAHRLVALAEEDGMLKLHEMLPVTDNTGVIKSFNLSTPVPADDKVLRAAVEAMAARGHKLLSVVENEGGQSIARVYRSAASGFYDTVNFMVVANSTEVWKFINISPDTHPMHIHLGDSQPLSRKIFNPNVAFMTARTGASDPVFAGLLWTGVDFDEATNQPKPQASADFRSTPCGSTVVYDDPATRLDANEKALKHTMRVNPGEMLSVAITFEQHCGRFVYHCHILEHEDHEMMRPFVVLPEELHGFMGHMAHQH